MRFRLFSVDFYFPFLVVALMSTVMILDTTFKVCACLVSAIIHETGHLIAMCLFSIKPKSITLKAFDIVIDADISNSFWSDLTVTLSGPLFNLLFSLAFFPVSKLLSLANICIGIFNLLPIQTFDGGHALTLLLCSRFSAHTSEKIIKVITFLFLVPFFFVGIMVLFYSKYNNSLLLISLYLVAILFTK